MSLQRVRDSHNFLLGKIRELLVLKDVDYYTEIVDLMLSSMAPASSGHTKHGAFDGGLLAHTREVFCIASSMRDGIVTRQGQIYESVPHVIRGDSGLLKVSILHDLNKLRTLGREPYYLPNMIKNGTVRSENKPWEINKNANPIAKIAGDLLSVSDGNRGWLLPFVEAEGIQYREGLVSLAVAEQICPGIYNTLSEDERNAVIYHDGAYAGRSGLAGKESALQILLHAADMMASRFCC